MEKIIFLDRDGTLNRLVFHKKYNQYGPPWKPEQISIDSQVFSGLRSFIDLNYGLVIVTNQPDIAKNKCSEKNLALVKERFLSEMEDNGVKFKAYFTCHHHPDAVNQDYLKDCPFRKPNIGFFEKFNKTCKVDKTLSWMIGDRSTDVAAGKAFGVRTIKLPGKETADKTINLNPDYRVPDLLSCVKIISNKKT